MIKIIPLPPNRVWRTYFGGKSLDLIVGENSPQDSHFPEDWIASLTTAVNPGREHLSEEGLSSVSIEGEMILLKSLIEKYPEDILGEEHYKKHGASTSFLLKFLDSAIRLHIQCHPTIPFAKQFLNSEYGKTEGYYILGTRDDVEFPFIYLGFQNPPSKEKFKEAIEKQDIEFLESCFEKIPVKKGDVFYVPGGLPHAIGEGVFMIEILEPTDLAVRIEFEKAGYTLPESARFMNRGIDFALSMFDYTPIPINTIKSKYFIQERLVSDTGTAKEYQLFDKTITNCFRMNKLYVTQNHTLKKDHFYILIVTDGMGQLKSGEETFHVKFGDKFLIPAATELVEINAKSSLELVIAMPAV
ncbi:class I mannose-6-phosphate isomerase [Gaoshiqia sediminis]|uniref:Phosphohexomutase n=1 Tax=Gaoshiqia sediminis TaxID=2986998 RepID=A0AA42CBF9_9BACT|nr:class I mannose-6-phosphate isomerase [Gaoshiqia sediminis]MCW0484970.1 class I mannose-6-phosphate isomerase [Gaoshiqia sediminis]